MIRVDKIQIMCIIKPEQYNGRDAKTTNLRKVVQRWIKLVMDKQDQKSPETPENIAETLLQGSRKIDRMRKDINDLVSMLRGLLKFVISGPSRKIRIDILVPELGLGTQWEIRGEFSPMNYGWERRIDFTFWAMNSTMWSSSTDEDSVKTKDIVLVYQALSALVNGLVKEFPELYTELAPFVSASKVQLLD